MAIDVRCFPVSVVLANGSKHSFEEVCSVLPGLIEYARGSADQQEMVFHLREWCLGREIPSHARQLLLDNFFLEDDGSLPDTLRDLVLSSAKGVGRGISIESPFTLESDEIMYQLVHLRTTLLDRYGPEVSMQMFQYGPDFIFNSTTTADGVGKYVDRIARLSSNPNVQSP